MAIGGEGETRSISCARLLGSALFPHNTTLTVGGQGGAVTIEYLQYNPDGTLKPVIQTEAGVSVPPPVN